jgi:hypothetical protein
VFPENKVKAASLVKGEGGVKSSSRHVAECNENSSAFERHIVHVSHFLPIHGSIHGQDVAIRATSRC